MIKLQNSIQRTGDCVSPPWGAWERKMVLTTPSPHAYMHTHKHTQTHTQTHTHKHTHKHTHTHTHTQKHT